MAIPEVDEGLAAAWERADRERAFWKANRAELTRRYPDQFVAVAHEQVIDTDPDFYVLVERLEAGGYDHLDVSISFMRFKSPPWLL